MPVRLPVPVHAPADPIGGAEREPLALSELRTVDADGDRLRARERVALLHAHGRRSDPVF